MALFTCCRECRSCRCLPLRWGRRADGAAWCVGTNTCLQAVRTIVKMFTLEVLRLVYLSDTVRVYLFDGWGNHFRGWRTSHSHFTISFAC